MRFVLFFQTHWQNICSVSALLFGRFCYIYFEINSYNKSSQNKQIFAVALCLYKLRCSSNSSKWSLSCCPHSQKIRKSIKILYFRCPGRPSQQHNSPHPQAFCWVCPHRTRRGWNQRQSSPQTPFRAAIHFLHMLLLTMKEPPCSLYPTTLWPSVGYPRKILWINPYRKPKFTPQTVSVTLGCKELKQWFTSTRIEKCLLGKASSGGKEWLQPHSLTLPTVCLQGPSVTASSDGFVQLGPLILRDSHTSSNVQAKQGSQTAHMGPKRADCVLVGCNL